jgi:hypothetical protein
MVGPLLSSAARFPIAGFRLSLLDARPSDAAMLPGLIVMGIGVGLFLSTLTNAALGALDPSRSGIGSGPILGTQLVSGAIGIGIAPTVFTALSRRHPDTPAGFVAGFHGATRVDAAIAVLRVFAVLGVFAALGVVATVRGRVADR